MKFTHGQRVTCKIDGVEIKDAKISIGSNGIPCICQDVKASGQFYGGPRLGYTYVWALRYDFTSPNVTDLKPAEKTWENLEKGDIIIQDTDEEAVVLEVFSSGFWKSWWGDADVSSGLYTFAQAQSKGWKIKQPTEDILELTLEDVAKLKGVDVSKIRIKE